MTSKRQYHLLSIGLEVLQFSLAKIQFNLLLYHPIFANKELVTLTVHQETIYHDPLVILRGSDKSPHPHNSADASSETLDYIHGRLPGQTMSILPQLTSSNAVLSATIQPCFVNVSL
ncbi:unnamed protein product [Phytophthora fragariaefolia]|uniref:Unnamed protein product n=1 Tax=Phytophthora fragariaefolia TaxID=1490495 RepID=A0A9W6XQ02_9STRA|nr:unnamed protein product [Phytophthora fragariaefolia]